MATEETLSKDVKDRSKGRRSSSRAMRLKRFLSIPIFSVLTAMGLVYYTTVVHFLEDLMGSDSFAGSFDLIMLTVFAVFSLYSFFVSVITDPGRVPSNYVPDVEGNQSSSQGIDKNNIRRCNKCSSYKPPRAHHCRVCRSCILKMDHHCVWINNCVGYRNYKAFILLLLYGAIGSSYSMVIYLKSTLQRDWNGQSVSLKGFYVASGVVIVGLTITLLTLLGWHVYLLIHNMTTIEYYEGLRGAWLARKSGQSYHHPFDVGAYRNITMILGPNILKWLWPNAAGHLKDGTAFPVLRDSS